jgi:hypothetical protein
MRARVPGPAAGMPDRYLGLLARGAGPAANVRYARAAGSGSPGVWCRRPGGWDCGHSRVLSTACGPGRQRDDRARRIRPFRAASAGHLSVSSCSRMTGVPSRSSPSPSAELPGNRGSGRGSPARISPPSQPAGRQRQLPRNFGGLDPSASGGCGRGRGLPGVLVNLRAAGRGCRGGAGDLAGRAGGAAGRGVGGEQRLGGGGPGVSCGT